MFLLLYFLHFDMFTFSKCFSLISRHDRAEGGRSGQPCRSSSRGSMRRRGRTWILSCRSSTPTSKTWSRRGSFCMQPTNQQLFFHPILQKKFAKFLSNSFVLNFCTEYIEDLGESSISLLQPASIQPRTSLVKFARSP